ncbi:MAG: transposase, partial [Planctomycetota bacterium]
RDRVDAGRLRGKAEIGVRVGKVVNAYKVGKHFDLEIEDKHFHFEINEQRVAAEAALDGIYVIRTSLPKKRLEAPAVVEACKRLCHVERAFRSFKTVDLHVRPIRHWTENRVRAHIFLCMLAYYVQYHMQEAWRPLLFFDEEAWTRTRQNPVAAAKRSRSALRKATTKTTGAGKAVHSFRTLLAELGGIVCNVCRRKGAGPDEPPVKMATKRNPVQSQALDLLNSIRM